MTAKNKVVLVFIFILLVFVVGVSAKPVKNVIVMIPDGMSQGGVTLTRWYLGGKPLAMDNLACGLVRTYSADAVIADSAPAATAMATGYKSHTGFISVLPEIAKMPGEKPIEPGQELRPVATVLEAARLAGKATGLVVTCEVMHATPAAFACHDPSRKNYDNLSEQEVYNGLDVVFGGGKMFFTKETRADKEDLIGQLGDMDYDVITTLEELRQLKTPRVFGLFSPDYPDGISYDIDRDKEKEPSLADMTSKAIELLEKDPDGFFLVVEGSKIDWAAHANDPVGLISEIAAFDRAVKVAVDFALANKNTVILIMSDHGNGGITLGASTTDKTYDTTVLDDYLKFLKKENIVTGTGLEKILLPIYRQVEVKFALSNIIKYDGINKEFETEIRNKIEEYYGIKDLTQEEIDSIKFTLAYKANNGKLNAVIGPIISKRSNLGWTTKGHTGEEVVLYAYSPNDDRPTGVLENTDIAKITANYLGVDLDAATQKLFVEAGSAFKVKGTVICTDKNPADPVNPSLVVEKGGKRIRIPVNKNYAIIIENGKETKIKLDGVAVYIEAKDRWYISRKAVDLLE